MYLHAQVAFAWLYIYTCMIVYTLHMHTMIAYIYLYRCRCNTPWVVPWPLAQTLSHFGVEVKPPGGLARLLPIGEKILGDLSTIGCTAEGTATLNCSSQPVISWTTSMISFLSTTLRKMFGRSVVAAMTAELLICRVVYNSCFKHSLARSCCQASTLVLDGMMLLISPSSRKSLRKLSPLQSIR